MMPGACTHTGLPQSMCGHCNGTRALEKPDFLSRGLDDAPQFIKGRDKAEWRGSGRSTGNVGGMQARSASAAGSYRGPWRPKSAWAQAQIIRTIEDLPLDVQMIVAEAREENRQRRLDVLMHGVDNPETTHAGRSIIGCKTTAAPPKNRKPAIPDGVVPSKWHLHHSGDAHQSDQVRTRRHAKNAGRTASRAHWKPTGVKAME